MTAIAAVSRTVKTMADGTLRLTVDIEPMHANEAFALFGAGNVPMALAALVPGTPMPEPKEPEIKGGELARLAGMLINNQRFQSYMAETYNLDGSLTVMLACDKALKEVCEITSKKELDSNKSAAFRFHSWIRQPFLEWQQGRRPSI